MAESLYNVDELDSQTISTLAGKARSRNAGEGMSDYKTALDQIRYEENQLFDTNPEYAELRNFRGAGQLYNDFTRQDGELSKDATPEEKMAYLDQRVQAYGGIERIGGQAAYGRIASDIQSGNMEFGQNFSNLYETRGSIAAANAAKAYFSGTQEQDDYSEVVDTYVPESIQGQGELQSQTTAQGESLATKGQKVSSTGLSYTKNGVDVSVPAGTFAVTYGNGAVEFRRLPKSGRIPQPGEISASSREGADVGSVGKEVARTGATAKNPKTNADFEVGEDEYVIEYTDGTYETRKRPEGGFIPSPEQLSQGGDSSASQSLEQGGKSLQDLKADQGLSLSVQELINSGASPEEIDKAIAEAGLKPTSELELIGKSVNGRTASPGNMFYQDPETRKILERPDALQDLAQPSTSTSVGRNIPSMFMAVFGREGTPEELKYWQGRTDKSGAALIGAMQFAKQNGTDNKPATADPVENMKNTANELQNKFVNAYKDGGVTSGSDERKQARAEREALKTPEKFDAVGFTKDQLASTQFQEAQNDLNQAKNALRTLENQYTQGLIEAERTPGLSMGAIRRNQGELDIAFQRERAQLTQEVQAYSDIVQSQMAITGMMIDAFKFNAQQAQVEYQNQVNRATDMYNMIRQDEQDDFNIQQKLQDNARANLTVVTNMLTSGNMDYDSLSTEQRAQLSHMEQQVGLPAGFSSFVGKVAKDPVVTIGGNITGADGTVKTPVYTVDPSTGALKTSWITQPLKQRVPGSGGSGGKSEEQKRMEQEEKQVDQFRSDAADLGIQMSKDDIGWQTAWDALRTKYPQASVEAIDNALGIGKRQPFEY